MGALYYNPRTLSFGSGEPLSAAKPPRNLLRTGWGPRGDSGPARGRVRATQPAKFPLPSFRPSLLPSLVVSSSRPKFASLSALRGFDQVGRILHQGVRARLLVPPIGTRRAS